LPFKNRNQQPEIRNCSYFLLFLLTSHLRPASISALKFEGM